MNGFALRRQGVLGAAGAATSTFLIPVAATELRGISRDLVAWGD
jgi:hypothetical protein